MSRDADDDFWYVPGMAGNRTASGAIVSPDTAMKLTAVYACVKVIAESVMQLPLILYRTTEHGKERADDNPLYQLLKDQPNEEMTSAEWREVMQSHLLLRGSAYSPLTIDSLRVVRELGTPLHPDHVTPEDLPGNRFRYVIREPGKAAYALMPHEMLHVRAMVMGGRVGMNPIQVEREAVGVGMAAQDMAARFFKNDAQPGGWLSHPAHFAKPEDRQNFARSWQQAHSGANHGKTAVLEYGMEYHPIQMRLRDAEFLATRKYQNLDICRIFRVPPHLIMEMDRATFSNIASQGIEFVKFTLMPWLKRWEQKLNSQLLGPDSEFFFEFLVDGLERGDPEMRARVFNIGITNGSVTRNEAREAENRNRLPGLDEPLQPMNMGGASDNSSPPSGAPMNAPPDEDDDEERATASAALARKWRHELEMLSPDVAAMWGYLDGQAGTASRILGCDLRRAGQHVELAVSSLSDWNLSTDGYFDNWEREQAQRLMNGS